MPAQTRRQFFATIAAATFAEIAGGRMSHATIEYVPHSLPRRPRIIGHYTVNRHGERRESTNPHIDHLELLKRYADHAVLCGPIYAGDWV